MTDIYNILELYNVIIMHYSSNIKVHIYGSAIDDGVGGSGFTIATVLFHKDILR